MRSSKDLARRLRFDHFPRPDRFRRWYLAVAVLCVVLAAATWVLFALRWRDRQYLPGPVAAAHATFGDRCERCHSAFEPVADRACLECHAARVHSEFESATPRCAACHVEHRGDTALIAVSNHLCVDCHGALQSTRRPQPLVQTAVHSFAEHPQFTPLRSGQADRAALRFNHKLHLTSDRIAKADTLSCALCHIPAADGRLMQAIVFDTHCQRCHPQKPPADIGAVEAPHREPEVVRDSIASQLLVLAVQGPETIFLGRKSTLPGVSDREPLSAARSLRGFQSEWLEKIEATLYKPLDPQAPLLDANKYCFLCHDRDGNVSESGLPKIQPTEIRRRWLGRGEFSHRRHDLLACATCHEGVRDSERTSDVNLPKRELCQRCHADGVSQTAGTQCMLCHLYHDTSKHPEIRRDKAPQVKLEALLGQ